MKTVWVLCCFDIGDDDNFTVFAYSHRPSLHDINQSLNGVNCEAMKDDEYVNLMECGSSYGNQSCSIEEIALTESEQ